MDDGMKCIPIEDLRSVLVEELGDGMELIHIEDVRSVLVEDRGQLGFKNFKEICTDVAENLQLEINEVFEEIVHIKLRRLEHDKKTIETIGEGKNRRWKIRFMY